jgi:hypothetical protein
MFPASSIPPPPGAAIAAVVVNRFDLPLQPSNQLIVTSLVFILPLLSGPAHAIVIAPSRCHYRTLSPCPCPPHLSSITSSVDCYFLLAIAHATSLSTLTPSCGNWCRCCQLRQWQSWFAHMMHQNQKKDDIDGA